MLYPCYDVFLILSGTAALDHVSHVSSYMYEWALNLPIVIYEYAPIHYPSPALGYTLDKLDIPANSPGFWLNN